MKLFSSFYCYTTTTIMSSVPLIWKEGLRSTPSKPRAVNIPAEKWQAYRDIIYQEYMVQDSSLKRVVQHMRQNHNFFAT